MAHYKLTYIDNGDDPIAIDIVENNMTWLWLKKAATTGKLGAKRKIYPAFLQVNNPDALPNGIDSLQIIVYRNVKTLNAHTQEIARTCVRWIQAQTND
jgi:hypothetical protein